MKSNRRRSPIRSKKSNERAENDGGSSSSGTSFFGIAPIPRSDCSSNVYPSSSKTSPTLLATPSITQSLTLSKASKDRSHIYRTGSLVTPTGSSSAAAFADELLDDDFIQLEVHNIRELIRKEQTDCNKDVDEYLLLALRADKQQRIRLKAHLKKKKTRSTQQIHMLQQKLDEFQKALRELKAREAAKVCDQHQERQILADAITKPKELAHFASNPFGSDANNSIDNVVPVEIVATNSTLNTMGLYAGNFNSFPGHDSQPAVVSTPVVAPTFSKGSDGDFYISSEDGSQYESSMMTSKSTPEHYHSGLEPLFQEIQERREECDRLRQEMETVKLDLLQEVSVMSTSLEEEQIRVQQLREKMIDLSELNQNEIQSLKQNIADMEEKVQYQSEERLRDIYDSIDGFQARITEVECQAQNYVSLEGIENLNARTVFVILLNLVLMALVAVFAAANTIAPFFMTRLRKVTTCVLLALLSAFILFWIWGYI